MTSYETRRHIFCSQVKIWIKFELIHPLAIVQNNKHSQGFPVVAEMSKQILNLKNKISSFQQNQNHKLKSDYSWDICEVSRDLSPPTSFSTLLLAENQTHQTLFSPRKQAAFSYQNTSNHAQERLQLWWSHETPAIMITSFYVWEISASRKEENKYHFT